MENNKEVKQRKQIKKNTIKLDWFSMVVMLPENIKKGDVKLFLEKYFNDFFVEELFEYRQSGKYLYNRWYSFANIVNILFNENNYSIKNNMGLLFEVSGLGLDYLRSATGCDKIENYLIELVEGIKSDGYQVRIKRFDIAYDDYRSKPHLPLRKIAKKVDKGEFVSKIRKTGKLEKREIVKYSKSQKLGDTVYLGSSSSDVSFRFYDKRLEQISKEGGCDLKNWLRYELVVKNDKALALLGEIKDNGLDKTYFSFIKSYLRFIEKSNDTNKSRVPVADFWQKFLDSGKFIKDFKLKKFEKKENILGTVDWLVNVSAPLILGQVLSKGEDLSSLDLTNLNDKQLAQVQSFLRLDKSQQQEVVSKLKDIFQR